VLGEHLFRKTQLTADTSDFVLKQLAQRLDQRKRKVLGKPPYIMMRLDRLRRASHGHGFDHVGIECPLNEESGAVRAGGQLAGLFMGLGAGERISFECFAPGQRVTGGTMNFEEDQPYPSISFLIEMLGKARAVAALHSENPTLPEEYKSRQSLSEIQALHEMLIGEGRRRTTTSARVRVTVGRGGLKKFLADFEDCSLLGTLNLNGDGSFPFLGGSIRIESLERVVTNMRLINTRRSLQDQLERSPNKRNFHLDWEATEATETILRERQADEAKATVGVNKAG